MDFSIRTGAGPLIEPVAFGDAEYRRRLGGIRMGMAAAGVDALVIFTPENINYVTGHDTPGYYFYQACVVTQEHAPVNVTRKLEASNTLGRSWSRQVVEYDDTEDPVAATLWLLNELCVVGTRIAAESDAFFVTPRQFERLRTGVSQSSGRLIEGCGLVEKMRMIKSEDELACIRRGAPAVEAAMTAAFQEVAEGVTERHVAARMIKELIEHGSGYPSLPPFVPTGRRASLAHATWSDKVIQKGDWLSYDVAASIDRYTCAMYRMGVVGAPSAELLRKMDACESALVNMLEVAKPGVTAGEVFTAGHSTLLSAGYDDGVGRRLGYSLGLSYPPDWGEGHIIDLRPGSTKVLQAGMVFHATPGLVEEGLGVVNIGETFIVTDNRAEQVTQLSRKLYIA